MRTVPYASTMGSLIYAILCTRPNISFVVVMVSRYYSNPRPLHWVIVKHILKYLRRTRNYMLVYHNGDLIATGYTNSEFQFDHDPWRSSSGYVFTLADGAINWRSFKSCIADSTIEADYVAACEVAKEDIWLIKFLMDLGVMRMEQSLITLFFENSGAVVQSKEPRNHKKGKHIECKCNVHNIK